MYKLRFSTRRECLFVAPNPIAQLRFAHEVAHHLMSLDETVRVAGGIWWDMVSGLGYREFSEHHRPIGIPGLS